MAPTKTVVIVGGSWAGIKTTHAILKGISNVKVILINPSATHYFNIAAPRILAKPTAFAPEKYTFYIPELFEKYNAEIFSFIQGAAQSIDIDGKTVAIATAAVEGKEARELVVPFDYLVIASGSTTLATLGRDSVLAPFKTTGSDDLQSTIEQAQKTLAEAETAIIGGAGAVGVEFAGELAEAFQSKKGASVTLLTNTDRILPELKPGASSSADSTLSRLGVKIRTSVMIAGASQDSASKQWTVTLEGGETLTADAYISTTGVIPNNSFIPADLRAGGGWVPIDAEFRVQRQGKDNEKLPIYAVGDITTLAPRLLNTVAGQVPVLVANLKADIEKSTANRRQYSGPGMTTVVVPIGARSGTGQIWFFVVWGWLVWLVKGRDYFLFMAGSLLRS
ncbi:hypothetical protein AJ79_07532 [Helicocarpus griseus UAMH5409]|uniref:FAD/NAD(P)-binding domain-containing protein n=1 Tax=Helicocarpus griseus UAMH5409 TaxID=1447875 RepID=A0A2B7X1E1_9EURO|nr:hypothetical protein AJ79_07532 [Helicocarpus griseus UAMH5409]